VVCSFGRIRFLFAHPLIFLAISA